MYIEDMCGESIEQSARYSGKNSVDLIVNKL